MSELLDVKRLRIPDVLEITPKRFGDKMQVTGKDGGAIEHQHKHDVAKVLDDIDGAGTGLPAHDRRG